MSSSSTLQLARDIVSRSSRAAVGGGQESEISSLLAQLANSLRTTTATHLRTSLVPRVPEPRGDDRRHPTPSCSEEAFERIVAESSSTNRPGPQIDEKSDETISNARRAPLSQANATYGETPPATVRTLLSTLASAKYSAGSMGGGNANGTFDGNFVDAGSGNGIATACAAATGRFGLCRGIEFDAARHGRAVRLQDAYERRDMEGPNGINSQGTSCSSRLEYTCGDLKDEAFDGASVVLANSVVWDADLCGAVGRRLDEAAMAGPALVATISRRLPSPSFDLVDILTMPCNGGEDFTFYVCQKSGPGVDAGAGGGSRSFAVSDSLPMRQLREEDEGLLLEKLIGFSMNSGNEGMAFLASVAASESSTRVLLSDNDDILTFLAQRLAMEEGLVTRASSSLALRAMADFPTGRRRIAENSTVVETLVGSLVGTGDTCSANDHPAIRTNVLDILGQVLNDPVGYVSIGTHDIDLVLHKVREDAAAKGWHDVMESCNETGQMQRWCGGEQRSLDGNWTWNVLRSD